MGKPGARIGDHHVCPMVDPGPKPHVGGPVVQGNPTVMVGGMPAATLGDQCVCCGPPDAIAQGEPTVMIGGKPAATMGSSTAHGGTIVAGCPTVLIGSSGGGGGGGATVTKKPKSQKNKKPKNQKSKHKTKKGGKTKNGKGSPKTKNTCTNGCPISMVTGEELLEQLDFVLEGPFDLEWNRTYRTTNSEDRQLGHGWTHPLSESILTSKDLIKYNNYEGREIEFKTPGVGEKSKNLAEKLSLFRETESKYILLDDSGDQPDKIFSGNRSELFIIGMEDNCGNEIQIQYGDLNQPTRIFTSWGKMLWVHYDNMNRIASITPGEFGETEPTQQPYVRYEYSLEGDLIAAFDRAGNAERFEFKNHIITKRTSKTGFNIRFTWDQYTPDAKCLHHQGDRGIYDIKFEWYPDECKSVAIDSRGGVFTYFYDANGQIIHEIDAEGGETFREYDDSNNLIVETDPNGNKTEFEYDDEARLIKTIDSEGNASEIEYEGNNPIVLTDPTGNRWEREYNADDLLIKTKDPQGNEVQYDYNKFGLPSLIINEMGFEKRLHWNEKAQLIRESDFQEQETKYQYDADGNVVAIQEPDGSVTQYQYNLNGEVTAARLPNGKDIYITYNEAGNITSYTDTAGRITKYEYEQLSQITKRIDPTGQVFEYFYDKERNLTGLKNEKNELYQLHYDLNENLTKEVGFDGRVQNYQYDPAGILVSHAEGQLPETDEDGNPLDSDNASESKPIQTDFERDTLGRLLAVKTEDGCDTSFAYDELGRLTEAGNEHTTVVFAYDELGQLVSETQGESETKHQYNPVGDRVATILPDGKQLDYQYGVNGDFAAISLGEKILTRVWRDQVGREVAREQGSLQSAFQYDQMGRLSSHKVANKANKAQVISRDYGYDSAGNLALIKDMKKGEINFKYDALDRLTHAKGIINETFSHDPASNIISHSGESVNLGKGNRLHMQGDRKFEYDDRGNLIEEKRGKEGKLLTKFHYNSQNQLVKVEKNGQEIEYKYDALGRRIAKIDKFGESTFLWNEDVLLQENRKNIKKTYIYEPDSFRPLAFLQDEKVYYYHLDHLGTPQEITSYEGEVVWSARYKAYGNLAQKDIEQVENNLRFQGQYYDEETGLHYNRHRYYDPEHGRFINQDPIGLNGGDNNYQYAPNPVSWIDPFGLACKDSKQLKKSKKKEANEGIYEFTDTNGKKYVGQSKNIDKRLKQHIKSGKLDKNQTVKRTEVLGGKTKREIAEHKRIQQITGGVPARYSNKVSNKVDPIGPNRRHLLGG